MRRRLALRAIALCGIGLRTGSPHGQPAGTLDHGYAAWDALLRKHVQWLPDGSQSRVDYQALARDRPELQRILREWSGLSRAAFEGFGREQQMAFLINAYNGFTLELVLGRYPAVQSIKDLGTFLQSAWKRPFFQLLGEPHHLDWIEHEQLRPVYRDPRLHAALNCASIGCPALRPQAFVATRLDAQLDDGMRRFLADRTRNRLADGKLQVSPIFKWYREDFEQGYRALHRLEDLMAQHALQLADDPAARELIRSKTVPIVFLDYDWSLNDRGR